MMMMVVVVKSIDVGENRKQSREERAKLYKVVREKVFSTGKAGLWIILL